MNRGRLALAAVLTGVLLPVLASTAGQPHARAESALPPVGVTGMQQVDLTGDGRPDEAIIDCSCVTAHDRVLVFDPAGDMPTTTSWRQATNLAHDTWVFDVGARGRASLIIKFSTGNGRQVASLYDGSVDASLASEATVSYTNVGSVSYHLDKANVIVDRSQYWSLQITAHPTWFLANGKPNLNISALMDKPFVNSFDFVDKVTAYHFMHHNGKPDIAFDEAANPVTGVAQYSVTRLLADISAKYQIGRARLWANVGNVSSKVPSSALFFPFLAFRPDTTAVRIIHRAFDYVPQIYMDWQDASILGVGENGYPAVDGFFLNDQTPIKFGQINDISYEAPHAWYDLANARGHNPSLELRSFTPISFPWQEIRYSWIQNDPSHLIWDYKLGMMGNPKIPVEVVRFQNFAVRMVPYAKLPFWLMSQKWKLNTFVAREGGSQQSSEGIYLWSPLAGVNQVDLHNPTIATTNAAIAYISGASNVNAASFYNSIPRGYRGEYNLTHPLQPLLYYSPVDRRLHLKGAEHGLLNTVNGTLVAYDNNNGGSYLDQWTAWQKSTQVQGLYKAGPILTFSSASGIAIRRTTDAPDALFQTFAPRNHQEWLTLGAKLKQGGTAMAPDDLPAMFDQFRGPTLSIPGAKVQDFRRVGATGFRFAFSLTSATRVRGGGLIPDSTLARGNYLLTFDGTYHITSPRPGAVSIDIVAGSMTQYRAGAVSIAMRNAGLTDITPAKLELWAALPGHKARIVKALNVSLPAMADTTATVQWTPLAAGSWTLTPRIIGAGNARLHITPATVNVAAVIPVSAVTLLDTTSVPAGAGFVVLGLAVLVLIGAVVWAQQIRTVREA